MFFYKLCIKYGGLGIYFYFMRIFDFLFGNMFYEVNCWDDYV